MKKSVLLASVSLLCVLSAQAEVRVWKEAGTNREIKGELVRVQGNEAWIRKADGVVAKVATERFSEADQTLIAAFQQAKPTATGEEQPKNVYKWETDYKAALARAKEENKAVLLDFTGSDWCTWCKRLKKEVFEEKAFKDYAKENLILVELDFPQGKKLDKKLEKQNADLAAEYKIAGYPTIIVLNSKGKPVGKTGYKEGGPEAYVDHLKEMLK